MRFLYIIYYLWNNTSYWIVQGMGITSFTCDSLHLIDTWLFSSFNENHELRNFTSESRETFEIFVSRFLQYTVNDVLPTLKI